MKSKDIKILIVEDEAISAMTIEENLRSLGYGISGIVDKGEDAIDSINENKPDLILMDIFLKGRMTGIDVAKAIFKDFNIPIVYLTASTSEHVFEEAKTGGIYGFIIKPFEVKELKINVEIALYKHAVEQKIQKDKYLLDVAQKIAHVGHWELNHKTGKLKWSDETYRIFEIDSLHFKPNYNTFLSLIHPDDRDKVNFAYDEALKNKTLYSIDHRIIFDDGRIKYVKESGETVYDVDGTPIISIGTIHDITASKKAEIKLQQSEQNFKELFLNSIDEVYLIDIESFNFISVNSTVTIELGYEENDIIKMNLSQIILDKRIDILKTKLEELEYEDSFQIQTFHKKKDGSFYPVEIKFKKIFYSGNSVILAQARNITELLEYESKKDNERKVREILNSLLSVTLEDRAIKSFLDEALDLIVSLPYFLDLSKAAIFTTQDENNLQLVSHVNFEKELIKSCSQVEKGFCMCGIAFQTKTIQYAPCNDNRFKVNYSFQSKLGNYVIPIMNENIILGVLSIYLKNGHERDESELEVLTTIANTLGVLLTRKNNQEELKNNENRLREITETIKEVFWLMDCQTKKLLYISPSYEEIYEKTCISLHEDVKSWSDSIHPEDKERVVDEYTKCENGNYNTEFRLLFSDGRVKWIHERAFPIIENNKVVRMSGYSIDITKRKLIEEKLKLSEEKFRTYIENSADVLTITNEKFEIEYNSPNNNAVFGYDKDENIGVNAVELIHPDDITKFNNSFYDTKKKKNVPIFFQYRFKHKTDGWKWVDSSIKYVDNEKQTPYFIVNSRDISKRKEIENRFTSVIEQAEDHILITDDDGVIEYVNPVMLNFLGYSQKEIYGAKPSILKPYNRCRSMYKELWRTIKSGKTYQNEFINKKKNGEIYVAQTIIVPLRNTKNEISHFASIGRNITDKRESEKKMTSLIENKKKRISKELHDGIGQTLTAIKFSIGAIVDSSLQENKETLENIKQLIDQSTKEVHEVSFDLMPSVLGDYGLKAAIKKLITYLNENTDMEIKFTFDDKIERLNKDVEIGIYRIIQEGLNNAQKYAKSSLVNITLELRRKIILLSIADNGVGFDTNNIISKKAEGGQGINNMRYRTKLIEGDIEIKSDKNKGTLIEVVIPLNYE